ncbi:unnamed protein product [Mucor fragilis]
MRLSCSVCLEEATDNSELVSLTACGHVFDAECIAQCMLLNAKCPLCNQCLLDSHPIYKRVYFSALDRDGNGKDASKAAQEEVEAAKDALDQLNQEYDDLAIKWTVVKDELNAINREKTQLENDSVMKDAHIDKLTHNWQTSKARNKDDVDRMNLKLISKQKSIDLLTKNLDKSNKRIQSLKEELDAFKPQDTQDNALPYKPKYRDQQFKTKYYDLNKEHKALKDKMGQLEKKFIELTLISAPSSNLPVQTEALQAKVHQLEKQLQASAAKESKLLKEVMRFKQLKQDAVKEKEDLKAKLANAEAAIASLDHGTKMGDPPREQADCDTVSEEA